MSSQAWTARNVSVAVLNYNGVRILDDCLRSIRELQSPPLEILLVDDGSSDGSPEWVRGHHPEVRVVEMGSNTKRLNKVRNRALAEARGDLVLIVDNDVMLRADALEELLAALNRLPGAAVCMPRALFQHDPSLIYQDGQVLHYVGASWAIHRNEPVAGSEDQPRRSIGWGVQLIDKAQAAEVGNFNEDYVMGWGDDGEFNHKMNLSGRFCYHVPAAVVYHKRTEGAQRYYGTVRNRWRFLLESYEWKTLVICAPSLLLYEASLMLYLLKKGAISQYFRAIGYVISNLSSIFAVRRRIQASRRLRDKELMTSGTIFIAPEYVDSRWLSLGFRSLNCFLDGYWRAVQWAL